MLIQLERESQGQNAPGSENERERELEGGHEGKEANEEKKEKMWFHQKNSDWREAAW